MDVRLYKGLYLIGNVACELNVVSHFICISSVLFFIVFILLYFYTIIYFVVAI